MAFDQPSGNSSETTPHTSQPTTSSTGGREERRETSLLSPPVEAVVRFGFPPETVFRVYNRLKELESRRLVETNGSDVRGPGSDAGRRPSAAVLLLAVDSEGAGYYDDGASARNNDNAVDEDGPGDDDVTNNTNPLLGVRSDVAAAQKAASATNETTSSNHVTQTSDVAPSTAEMSSGGSRGQGQTSGDLAESQGRSRSSSDLGNNGGALPGAAAAAETTGTTTTTAAAVTRDRSLSPSREVTRRPETERLRALKVENRRLRARNTCRHCRQRPVSLTLLPCGHFCFCQECGSTFSACPVCRKTILADVRTFVS